MKWEFIGPCSVRMHNGIELHPGGEGAARLIAAAPEMLEALERILAHYRIIDGGPDFQDAQAAVRKARGER